MNNIILSGKAYSVKKTEDKPGEKCISFKLYQKKLSGGNDHQQWIPIRVWGPLAEYADRNIKKEGQYVVIRGELEIRQNENGFLWFIRTNQIDVAFSDGDNRG